MKKFKEVFIVHRDQENNFYREPQKDEDGKDTTLPVKLAVVKPSYKQQQSAQQFYTKRWKELMEQGAPLRIELNDLLRQRKLWNDEMQKQEDELLTKITDNLDTIKKGKIKLSKAEKLMKDNIKYKSELILLRFNRNQLDGNTAEAQADQDRFNYLVATCTIYDDDHKPFFSSLEHYLSESEKENPVTLLSGEAFWRLTTNTSEDYREEWPEFQFLKKYKLVDEKLRFVKDNKLVDIDGKPVDEDGNYLNEEGGKLVDESPFGEMLDEEGNSISV